MSWLYRCATLLYALPLAIAILVRALLGQRNDLERLGFTVPRRESTRPLLWLVASSVGEAGIATTLCAALKRAADVEIALTVTTSTGRKQAEKMRVGFDYLYFHPLDVGGATRRMVRRLRPTALLIVETELWPTLLRQALRHEVKLIQVAGRISEKTISRYLWVRRLFAPVLEGYSALLCQSRADAERFEQLGAPSDRIEVSGSPKESYQPPAEDKLTELREYLTGWAGMPIFVAGSTRTGEEEIILAAFLEARTTLPELKLVLAPRHLKRIADLEAVLRRSGVGWQRRSVGELTAEQEVLLLDTHGELNCVYHLGDLAFVGATLVPLGGHNLLEPALAGIPVLHGPHVFDQQPGAEALRRYQLGQQVSDAEELAHQIVALLRDGTPRKKVAPQVEELRTASADVIDEYVKRIMEVVKPEDVSDKKIYS